MMRVMLMMYDDDDDDDVCDPTPWLKQDCVVTAVTRGF
jgi:hypothetical protein